MIRTFSGSDLENYFNDVVSSSCLRCGSLSPTEPLRAPALSAQPGIRPQPPVSIPLSADLQSCRVGITDPAILVFRSQTCAHNTFHISPHHGRLDAELERVRKMPPAARTTPQQLAASDPVAAEFIAEADLWRCHYEAAAPLMRGLAANYPTDFTLDRRTSNLLSFACCV